MIKLDHEIVEYVKKTKISWSVKPDPNCVNVIHEKPKIKNEKIGVFVAGINPENPDQIVVGYSLCSPIDTFDIDPSTKEKRPGFGKEIALSRSVRWAERDAIYVPVKLQKKFNKFLDRCAKYYKDKNLPPWEANDFISKEI